MGDEHNLVLAARPRTRAAARLRRAATTQPTARRKQCARGATPGRSRARGRDAAAQCQCLRCILSPRSKRMTPACAAGQASGRVRGWGVVLLRRRRRKERKGGGVVRLGQARAQSRDRPDPSTVTTRRAEWCSGADHAPPASWPSGGIPVRSGNSPAPRASPHRDVVAVNLTVASYRPNSAPPALFGGRSQRVERDRRRKDEQAVICVPDRPTRRLAPARARGSRGLAADAAPNPPPPSAPEPKRRPVGRFGQPGPTAPMSCRVAGGAGPAR